MSGEERREPLLFSMVIVGMLLADRLDLGSDETHRAVRQHHLIVVGECDAGLTLDAGVRGGVAESVYTGLTYWRK